MSLPIFQTSIRELSQMQTKWASEINPILQSPIANGLQLVNQEVSTGVNTINHRLGRKLQGYIVVGKNANVSIWDSQSTNQLADKTLILNSSGNAVISLWVY